MTNPESNPADTYERSIVPYLFRPWARDLVRRMDVQPGDRVLDIACGTGVVVREVVARTGTPSSVVGVDFNPEMLAVAQREAERAGIAAEWRQADAQQLPFEDESFDVVLCQQGLQFVPDRAVAVREMHRVLASGGRLGLSVWRELRLHPFFEALDAVMRERFNIAAASTPFGFADADALRDLLADAGFLDVTVEQPSKVARYPEPQRNLYETVHALVAVAPALQSLSAPERARLIEEVCDQMQEAHAAVTDGDHVALDWHANVATARRM